MEGKGGEVTQKIRTLITKKLVELGVFVDEELPDYIMVMVANKKSRGTMSDDLKLFLGSHTSHFTDWLNGILENLPSSVSSHAPADKKPQVTLVEKELVIDDGDNDTFAFKADVTDDFLAEELKQESSKKSSVATVAKKKVDDANKIAAKVRPILRQRPTVKRRTILADREEEEGEYDPRNPAVGSVASIVRVTRQRWKLPPVVQANKLLLLKAVDEANKSVKGRTKSIPYCPTPIRCLTREEKRLPDQLQAVREPIEDQELEGEEEEAIVTFLEEEPDLRLLLKARITESPVVRGIKRKLDSTDLRTSKDGDPKFVVTLDGIDPSSFVRSVVGEKIRRTEDLDSSSEEGEGEQRTKIPERCRYWPACRDGDACARHHPTLPCRSFPKCHFGDKCLFIHPNCRFDSRCSRKECPYTHASKRLPMPTLNTAFAVPLVVWKKPKPCKYLSRCNNAKCRFVHPKPCRFGELCHAVDCPFAHPLPSPERLKWEASQQSPLLP